jgi:hypothetical protein
LKTRAGKVERFRLAALNKTTPAMLSPNWRTSQACSMVKSNAFSPNGAWIGQGRCQHRQHCCHQPGEELRFAIHHEFTPSSVEWPERMNPPHTD